MGKKRLWPLELLISTITLVLVFVVTAVLVIFSTQSLTRNLQEQIGNRLVLTAEEAAERMDQFMWTRMQELEFLRSFEELFSRGNPAEISLALNRLQDAIPMFSWVGYVDLEGRVVAATDGLLVGSSIAERPVFLEALDGDFIGDVHDAQLLASLLPGPSGEPVRFVDISYQIYDLTGEPRGILAAHLSWEWMQQVRVSFLTGTEPGNIDLIVTSATDGTVILGPEQEIGLPASEVFAQAPAEASGYFEDSTRGDFLYGYTRTKGFGDFPGFGWTVLVREPYAIAYQGLNRQRLELWLAGLVIGTLSCLLGWYLSRVAARSLQNLHVMAEDLRLGDLEQVPVNSSIREIAGLADSLNFLSESLTAMETVAHHDPLTGVLNRAGVRDWLDKTTPICLRHNWTMVILVLDLDGFKQINDGFGHQAGDEVLRTVAERCKKIVRSEELVARWGGDEFVITLLAQEQDPESAGIRVAERILESLRQGLQLGNKVVSIGCSVGISLWDPDLEGGWHFAHDRADRALYKAKRSGKARYSIAL